MEMKHRELLELFAWFDDPQLRRFLEQLPYGDDIVNSLPSRGASKSMLSDEAIRALIHRNLLDEAFFLALLAARPLKGESIIRVAAKFGIQIRDDNDLGRVRWAAVLEAALVVVIALVVAYVARSPVILAGAALLSPTLLLRSAQSCQLGAKLYWKWRIQVDHLFLEIMAALDGPVRIFGANGFGIIFAIWPLLIQMVISGVYLALTLAFSVLTRFVATCLHLVEGLRNFRLNWHEAMWRTVSLKADPELVPGERDYDMAMRSMRFNRFKSSSPVVRDGMFQLLRVGNDAAPPINRDASYTPLRKGLVGFALVATLFYGWRTPSEEISVVEVLYILITLTLAYAVRTHTLGHLTTYLLKPLAVLMRLSIKSSLVVWSPLALTYGHVHRSQLDHEDFCDCARKSLLWSIQLKFYAAAFLAGITLGFLHLAGRLDLSGLIAEFLNCEASLAYPLICLAAVLGCVGGAFVVLGYFVIVDRVPGLIAEHRLRRVAAERRIRVFRLASGAIAAYLITLGLLLAILVLLSELMNICI